MIPQRISVLHVEDSKMTRVVIRGLLQQLPDYVFDFRIAESEETALASFRERAADLVILDYQLAEGDGLSCLRRLRGLDPIVPILAVSGAASPQIAAELLEGGADDFINKNQLHHATFGPCVRTALHRAAVWRARGRSQSKPSRLQQVGQRFIDSLSEEKAKSLLASLKELDEVLRTAGMVKEKAKDLADWASSEAAPADFARRALLRGIYEFVQAHG